MLVEYINHILEEGSILISARDTKLNSNWLGKEGIYWLTSGRSRDKTGSWHGWTRGSSELGFWLSPLTLLSFMLALLLCEVSPNLSEREILFQMITLELIFLLNLPSCVPIMACKMGIVLTGWAWFTHPFLSPSIISQAGLRGSFSYLMPPFKWQGRRMRKVFSSNKWWFCF